MSNVVVCFIVGKFNLNVGLQLRCKWHVEQRGW